MTTKKKESKVVRTTPYGNFLQEDSIQIFIHTFDKGTLISITKDEKGLFSHFYATKKTGQKDGQKKK